jgi:FMN phosphatase YigB (HAD superfamily)
MIIFKYITLEKYVMAKVILFDLGDTLEHNGSIREDAVETLQKIKDMKDINNESPILGLASDNEFRNPDDTPTTSDQARDIYYRLLRDKYKIANHFEPLDTNVTLSKDVGATKDENLQLFMQTAIDKIGNTSFNQIIFITENCKHIDSANSLGIKTIFLKLNNNSAVNNGNNTITNLSESINLIEGMLNN